MDGFLPAGIFSKSLSRINSALNFLLAHLNSRIIKVRLIPAKHIQ